MIHTEIYSNKQTKKNTTQKNNKKKQWPVHES